MLGFVPAIEIAHDENLLGVRRPDGEVCSRSTILVGGPGAELVVESKMVPFVKEVDIIIREKTRESVSSRQRYSPP